MSSNRSIRAGRDRHNPIARSSSRRYSYNSRQDLGGVNQGPFDVRPPPSSVYSQDTEWPSYSPESVRVVPAETEAEPQPRSSIEELLLSNGYRYSMESESHDPPPHTLTSDGTERRFTQLPTYNIPRSPVPSANLDKEPPPVPAPDLDKQLPPVPTTNRDKPLPRTPSRFGRLTRASKSVLKSASSRAVKLARRATEPMVRAYEQEQAKRTLWTRKSKVHAFVKK